jgi:hypothetical protein
MAQAQDLTLGYQFQRFSGGGDSYNAAAGFDVELTYPLTPTVSVDAGVDFSHHGESVTVLGTTADASNNHTAFAFGLRYIPMVSGTAKPFFQVRGGFMHTGFSGSVAGLSESESENDGLIDFGAGVGFPLSGRLEGVGEVFYRRIFTPEEGTNALGFVLGVRIPLH